MDGFDQNQQHRMGGVLLEGHSALALKFDLSRTWEFENSILICGIEKPGNTIRGKYRGIPDFVISHPPSQFASSGPFGATTPGL